ncbi:MAG: response regulator [Candidatus Paceibacteria bacterium]
MRILLVDDDMFLRDMYATKFSECAHEVVAVENTAEALRTLEQDKKFDVILMDMIMPGMSGTEFLESAKEILSQAGIKAIMLSNQGQDEDIDEAKAAGAIGYLIKAHMIPSEVVREVEKIMEAENKK